MARDDSETDDVAMAAIRIVCMAFALHASDPPDPERRRVFGEEIREFITSHPEWIERYERESVGAGHG